MIDATNQRVSGTSATAVTRCTRQCWEPFFAEPSPIARPRGERKERAIHQSHPPTNRLATQAAAVSVALVATTDHPEM